MQRISVTVTLNRTTLSFDEAAFQRLEQYLAEARRTLEGNLDQAEIMGDLEVEALETQGVPARLF